MTICGKVVVLRCLKKNMRCTRSLQQNVGKRERGKSAAETKTTNMTNVRQCKEH